VSEEDLLEARPTVSVVVIFFNGRGFLEEAIASVLAQTFSDWDLHLVDDGSTDGSSELALRYTREHPGRIHYHEHPGHANRGMSAARNLGVRRSSGMLVATMDGDDVWLPDKLREQVAIMEQHPEVDLLCGSPTYWFSWTGEPADQRRDRIVPPGAPLDQPIPPPEPIHLLYPLGPGVSPCPSEFLIRRELIEATGGWEEDFRGMYEDQAFLAKAYLHGTLYFSSGNWILYRRHPESITIQSRHDGSYAGIRRVYLEWLLGYLESHGIEDERLVAKVRRMLLSYRHPTLHDLLFAKRKTLRRVARAILPDRLVAAGRPLWHRIAGRPRSQ
jgi:glycosyltransferase involved in cell wall biosynthesis